MARALGALIITPSMTACPPTEIFSMDPLFQPIFFLEAFHPSGRVDQFLLAREKGMAAGTNLHGYLFLDGSGANLIAAGALDYRIYILRMNPLFHHNPPVEKPSAFSAQQKPKPLFKDLNGIR
jgi:hypothetical protein